MQRWEDGQWSTQNTQLTNIINTLGTSLAEQDFQQAMRIYKKLA
jgi:hypothetical protein